MLQLLRNMTWLLLLLPGLAGTGWAAARGVSELSGDVAFGAASYRAKVDGAEAVAASHLYQQYTVQYRRENPILDGRAGAYTLLLGYEHTALNPSLTDYGVDDPDARTMKRDKLYYQGQLLLAPGGLPFRLTMVAQDLHRSQLSTSYLPALPIGLAPDNTGHLFETDIFNDLNNGTHQVLGATLLVGIRNGSYLGAHRDILSQLPRLLVDYRQEDVDDTSSRFSPNKYRQRDLAFISLNKQNNWLHLRMRDYTDYLDASNDTREKQILLGTIDHNRQRQWIDLTNWLKLSADGSYTDYKQANDEIPQRTFAVNLFALGRREGAQLSLLSTFERVVDRYGIEQEVDVPLQTSIDLDRNTRIMNRLLFNGRKTGDYVELDPSLQARPANSTYDLFFETRAELNRSRRILYRPRLQLERYTASRGIESTAVKVGGEVATNSSTLAKAVTWLGGFDVTTVQGTNVAGAESGTFSQLDLYGRVDRDAARNWRYGARGALAYGSGDARAGSLSLRIPVLVSGGAQIRGMVSDPLAPDFTGEIVESTLSLYGEHRGLQWGNRFDLTHELRAQGGDTLQLVTLEHALQRDERNSRFEWRSIVESGDRGSIEDFRGDYLQDVTDLAGARTSWRSGALYELTPSRPLQLTFKGDLHGTTDQSLYTVAQGVNYTLYTRNGILRRLASCSEKLSYEGLLNGRGLYGRSSATRLQLALGYYPTRTYYLLGTAEYVLLQPTSSRIYVLTTNTGFNFSQLKVNLAYAVGNKSEESAFLPDVVEQRWSVDVKKYF